MTTKPAASGVAQSQTRPAPAPQPAFILTSHSFPGREHIYGALNGNGNQDSFGRREVANGLILVTADGCGSAADSATGSKAAVRIVLNAAQKLLEQDPIPAPEEFATQIQDQLLKRIKACARPLAADTDAMNGVILSSYLFTCLVAVVSPEWTAIIGCGDGVYALNGTIKVIAPREDNHPEYLAYLVCEPIPTGFENIGLKVFEKIDTAQVRTLFLGSDGVEPLLKPQGDSRLFKLERLWNDRDLRDNAAVQELFAPLQMDESALHSREGVGGSIIIKQKTLRAPFDDDTTFVLAIRNTAVSLPAAWSEYRRRYAPPPTPPVLYSPPASIEPGKTGAQTTQEPELVPAGSVSSAGAESATKNSAPTPAAAEPKKPTVVSEEADSFKTQLERFIEWLRSLFTRVMWGNRDDDNSSGPNGPTGGHS